MIPRRLKCASYSVPLILVLRIAFSRANEECPVSVDTPGSTTCLRPENFTQNPHEIPFRDLGGGGISVFASGAQVIVPSYTFQCCGTVTLWRTFVQPGGGREDGEYDITFQVWRPSDSVQSTGCYSLVGENVFRNIDLGSDGLVCEAPPAGSEIRVQPGDVVGFYGSHADGGERGVQIDDSINSERVWYDVDAQPGSDSQCMYSVGNGRTLQTFTNHAPILSVTIVAEECPQDSTSTAPTTTEQPTNLPTTKPPTEQPIKPPTEQPTEPPTELPTHASEATTAILTKGYRSSEVETTQDVETITSESETMTTKTRVPSKVELTWDRVIGIAFGGFGVLVILTAIIAMLTAILVRHCKQRKKKPEEKAIHTLIDASLSYNNIYVQRKFVQLNEYLNANRQCDDLEDYAIPYGLDASSSLTESARDMATECTTSHTYDQPTKHVPYQQHSETHYKSPRPQDHYDRLNHLGGPHGGVVPYAIGNTSLRSIQSKDSHWRCSTDTSHYTTKDPCFNIVSNVSYEVSESKKFPATKTHLQ